MKAIETLYKGYRFRSRLEARWAVFFDALGLTWEYEPEGFETSAGWYLPDFRLENSWLEVKPGVPGDLALLRAFAKEISPTLLILVTADPYACVTAPGRSSLMFQVDDFGDNPLWPISNGFIPDEVEWTENVAVPAARQARSARFEHGEAP